MNSYAKLCGRFVLVSITATLIVTAASAQSRAPGAKITLDQMKSLRTSDRVVVKFREGQHVEIGQQRISGMKSRDLADFNRALAEVGVPVSSIERMFPASDAKMNRDRAAVQRKSGRRLANLGLDYFIKIPQGSSAAEFADKLNHLPFVEFAEPAPVPAPPPIQTIPQAAPESSQESRSVSPNFAGFQYYKNAAPSGIGAVDGMGSDGAGTSFVDVEYSWQMDHEDIQIGNDRLINTGGSQQDPFTNTDHGTAVLGILAGRSNNYGVTGIVPGAKVMLAPANTQQLGYNPAGAIVAAAEKLSQGDVIVIEQQYGACGTDKFGPLESLQSVFDAVSYATARGIIVVAAAGNGSVNLDSRPCANRFDRNVRDSHAIIVGAGSSRDHSKLDFSSYGSRVDVQGWGENVVSTGYGDAFNATVRRRYTKQFNGTSSATPVVAGAVLMIQGIRRSCGLTPLAPAAMRQLLVRTGTPQVNSGTGKIGPLPNVTAALRAMGRDRCFMGRSLVGLL